MVDIKYMFYQCKKLNSLYLGNFKTSKCKNFKYMFYKCSTIQSLELSKFGVKLVENMQYKFSWSLNINDL